MKDVKKAAKKELKKFERATRELKVGYTGITMVHLLEITQALYVQGKYDLVSGICSAVMENRKEA